MPSVYLETTVISYLAARQSHQLSVAWHQKVTRDWWKTRRFDFDVYISDFVLLEASRGDEDAAQRRREFLSGLPVLEATDTVYEIAQALVAEVIPRAYTDDAFHVAVAAFHGVDYLVTWNCKHIANAELWKKIRIIVERFGCSFPIICTPEELLGLGDNS